MKRLSPFRIVTFITLLLFSASDALAATCCQNFVSGIICSVNQSAELIDSKLDITLSLTEIIISKFPNIYSSIEQLSALEQSILSTLVSILDLAILDGNKLEQLHDTTQTMLDKACTVVSINEVIDNTTQNTLSYAEQIVSTEETVLDKTMMMQSLLDPINNELVELNSKVDLLASACDATPIFTAPYTISIPGHYCLANDVTSNASNTILITTNNVTLNLNGHKVTNTNTNAILCNSNLSNISIANGAVTAAADGIHCSEGCYGIQLHNVQAINCDDTGLNFFVDESLNPITNVSIINCSTYNCFAGAILRQCKDMHITDCSFNNSGGGSGCVLVNTENTVLTNANACSNRTIGFALANCTKTVLSQCKALHNGVNNVNENSYGFFSINGTGNIFENCIADGTIINSTDLTRHVAGFALAGSESCSKIIGCESANAFAPFTTSIVNTATNVLGPIPYGILLEGTLVNGGSFSATPTVSTNGTLPISLAWSPDGQYIAVVNQNSNTLITFNATNPAAPVANTPVSSNGAGPASVTWSPDGKYIAVVNGTVNNLVTFNATNPAAPVANAPVSSSGTGPVSVAWSPDGNYIAVVKQSANTLVTFNATNPAAPVANTPVSSNGGGPVSVAWSPDGKYIAVVNQTSGTLVTFNATNPAAPVANPAVLTNGSSPRSVDWSPDGKYIAVVNESSGTLVTFNATNPAAPVANPVVSTSGSSPRSVVWSSDGKYIAVVNATTDTLVTFNATNPAVPVANPTVLTNGTFPRSVDWSPDGQYIAVVNQTSGTLVTFNAIDFPSNNIIKDNIVWCNNGGSAESPKGVGISGSNIANLIINNTSYCNNLFNYTFVTSPAIFNPLFDLTPTKLQNISLACAEPIPSFFNVHEQVNYISNQLQKLNIINNQARDIRSQLDSINLGNLASVIQQVYSKTDFIFQNIPNACGGLPITASITINTAGTYCLAGDITGNITINTSNVFLDLSDHILTATTGNAIDITSNQSRVTVSGGRVQASNGTGIAVATTGEQISIKNVIAESCLLGISLASDSNVIISKCDFVSNTTGLQVSSSTGVVITQCTAFNNTQAGISLISSTNNYIGDCKAIQTGNGSQTNSYGFVSTNGSGNIFENCLAENTQTATTAWQTAAAGFALTGTEQCSRIIDCTSCKNTVLTQTMAVDHTFTTTSGTTFTTTQTLVASGVPYGILLGSTLQVTSSALTVYNSFDAGSTATSDAVNAVAWSPDNTLLAIGGFFPAAGATDLKLYAFDPANTGTPLQRIASINPGTGNTADQIPSLDWSPNGKYLAVGGQLSANVSDLQVYYYDICNAVTPLVLWASADTNSGNTGDTVYAVSWSPNGQYLAAGGNLVGTVNNQDLKIYFFNPVETFTARLSEISITTAPDLADTSTIYSVDWSPNGSYLAIGGALDGTLPTHNVRVYSFTGGITPSITSIASVDPGTGGNSEEIRAVTWSPDGKYLAVGGRSLVFTDTNSNLVDSYNLKVYAFDVATSPTLLQIAATNIGAGNANDIVRSIDWSANGAYLAVGGQFPGSNQQDFRVFSFNPQRNNPLTQVSVNNPGTGLTTDSVNSVRWSPDGQWIATGGMYTGTSNDVVIYNALQFPQRNIIKDNTLFCNISSASMMQTGVGISGSSIANLIVNNWAYNNIVNWQFITNFFTQIFESVPSPLENVGITAYEAIVNPDTIGLNMLAIEDRTVDMTSKLAAILTIL